MMNGDGRRYRGEDRQCKDFKFTYQFEILLLLGPSERGQMIGLRLFHTG